MSRIKRTQAFTLVEMLVVVSIIAVMLSIAVPTLSQMGLFGSDPVRSAARKSITMLKAARINAGATRLDCGVVYIRELVNDSRGSTYDPVPAVSHLLMVRQLNPKELTVFRAHINAIQASITDTALGELLDTKQIFMPFGGEDGEIESFPPNGSVLFTDWRDPAAPALANDAATAATMGLIPIWVLNKDWEELTVSATTTWDELFLKPTKVEMAFVPVNEPPTRDDTFFDTLWHYRWPAHVFQPTGVLRDELYSKAPVRERYLITVGPAPNANVKIRFLEKENPTDPMVPALPSFIELFPTTGRVKAQDTRADL